MGVKQDSYFVHIALWICFSSMYSHTLSVTKIEEDNWLFNMGYLYCRRSQSCIPWLLIPNQVNWDHFHAYYKCFMCVYLKQHTMLLWMWQCLYSKTPSIRSELLQMNFGPPPQPPLHDHIMNDEICIFDRRSQKHTNFDCKFFHLQSCHYQMHEA